MTLSAIPRSENTISATTAGLVAMTRQDNMPVPPLSSTVSPCRADSISAAVVPGAKLLASTVKGPALPFMLRPFPAVPRGVDTMLTCGEVRADANRVEREFCGVVEAGREGGFLGELDLATEFDRCSGIPYQ